MDSSELLKRYAEGKRDFSWVDLQKTSLGGAILGRIRLSRAKLSGAILTGADLTQAFLLKAELVEANLQGADLAEANLQKADLTGANLQKANLVGVNLSKAVLAGVNLMGANLSDADLTGADLTGAVLEFANLMGAKLNGANLTGATLEGANLAETERYDADFTEATMPDGKVYADWAIENPEPDKPSEPEEPDEPHEYRYLIPKPRDITPDPEPLFPNKAGLTGEKFRRALPWKALLPLGIGYLCFGQQLAVCDASVWAWLLAASGAIAWYYDKVLTWLAPLAGVFAVMFSAPISLSIFLVVPIGLSAVATIFNCIFSGRGAYDSLKFSIWLWGSLLFLGAFLNGALAFPLVIAFICVTFGVQVWAGMGYLGFNKVQTVRVMASVAGMGLVLGGFIGLVF
ncbi:MAG: pentapeptide repeat-containing protein [Cyanobacteriota bacterium]|nr:pentapeptide repeat-containing protein [Cyanobacteriota bacterium]